MRASWIFVLICAALGLAAIAAYSDAVDNEFVGDDPIVFQRQLPYFEGLENIFFPPPGIPQWGSYYRPLIVVTYLVDEALAEGFWPEEEREDARRITYHASCVAYHALATILVFFFGVFLQHVTPGAFITGLTLITGLTDVVISMIKAMLFGMTAGLPVTLEGLVGPKGRVFGLDHFGYSAPYKVLDEKFGFTGENVYEQVVAYLKEYK